MTQVVSKSRSRNREETEAALLGAALELFAKKGFDATTTNAIAAAAGCSEVLIQRYFGGKNGLLLAVIHMDRGGDGYLRFLDMPLQASIEDEARMVFRHVVAFMAEHSAQMRVIISRLFVDPAFLADFHRIEIHGVTAHGIEARFKRYAANGMIDPAIDITAATELLMSLNFQLGFVHPELHGTTGAALEKLIDDFARLFSLAIKKAD